MSFDTKPLQLYQKLPSSSSSVSLSVDSEATAYFSQHFTITHTNSAFINILSIADNDLIDTSIYSLPFIHSKEIQYKINQLQKGLITNFTTKEEFVNTEGLHVFISLSIMALPPVDGEFAGGIMLLKNITQDLVRPELSRIHKDEIKKLEADLIRLSGLGEQLKNFVYIASHDLKEPLRTIGNFSQLLMRQCHGYIDDTGREYLAFILDGVRNMNDLVNDLTHYSELDSRPHAPAEFHFPTILYILEQMNRVELKKINGEMNADFIPENIIADKSKIRKMLEALLSNSIKFRKPGRPLRIDISGREIPGGWEIKFKDNGIGIQEEYFGKIFEMFKKLHCKSLYNGTGIGLALCRKIVEQHRGSISVESVAGEGATFTFSIMRPEV